ncbi:MAG: (S)-ureidoglycine aminohydrolase [Verrucomicrobiota bacterium]
MSSSNSENTPLFGTTRTVVAARHALITPDGHVPSAFPAWENATPFVILSPGIGAKLSQILIAFDDSGIARFPADQHEHALYFETGEGSLIAGDKEYSLTAGSFAFVPAKQALTLTSSQCARVTVFRKEFAPHADLETPPLICGSAHDIRSEPFLGYEGAQLQTLLPVDPRFDLAMNIFTYQPGATLPFVETHIMEHGLLMLSGQGVYRLEEAYYPVQAGDAIWMAPYCPQWFVAMGESPASYLYYKDVHRLP